MRGKELITMAKAATINPRTGKKLNIFNSKKFLRGFSTGFATLLIALGAFTVMLPVFWMISTSLK
jgi:ABC-type glycerol-3-phosphate transport system permease component